MIIPGPDGTYPHGNKIYPDDGGGLYAAVGLYQNYVLLDLGTITTWIAAPPEEAFRLSMAIGQKAIELSTRLGIQLRMDMHSLGAVGETGEVDRDGVHVFLNHANLIETRIKTPVQHIFMDAQGAFIYATQMMMLVHQLRPDLTAHMFPARGEA